MTDLRKAAEMALAGLKKSIGLHIRNDEELEPIIECLEAALAQNPLDIADRAYFAGKKDGIAETLAQPWDTSDMAYRPNGLSVEQEPVAWVKEGKERVGFGRIEERKYVQFDQTLPVGTPLYTTPPSKQEPVAWMYDFLNSDNRGEVIRNWVTQDIADIEREKGFNVRPLYTAPTSKPWVSLTEEEINSVWRKNLWKSVNAAIRAIEAKLKEKNNG